MRRLLPTLALGLLCTATYAATTLDSDTAKLSYSMGYKTGKQ